MLFIQQELRSWSKQLGVHWTSREAPARMICCIHDELLFEVRLEHYEGVKELVRLGMEQAQQGVPFLRVRLRHGRDWAHMSFDDHHHPR